MTTRALRKDRFTMWAAAAAWFPIVTFSTGCLRPADTIEELCQVEHGCVRRVCVRFDFGGSFPSHTGMRLLTMSADCPELLLVLLGPAIDRVAIIFRGILGRLRLLLS